VTTYRVSCDQCGFHLVVDDRIRAHAEARDHEAANPRHTVELLEL
jgi:hypothetical protein